MDIEADGPIPGPYSMVSLGMTMAGRMRGRHFEAISPDTHTFYVELRPISDDFVPQSMAVCGLDRDLLVREGRDPGGAMAEAAAWIKRVCRNSTPVLAAYPLSFDWMWIYWYFMNFTGSSPFGHSRCIDIKTLYAAKAGVTIGWATKRQMPRHLAAQRPHTHNALDDAMEQAELLQNLMAWPGSATAAGHDQATAEVSEEGPRA
ncbi:exonuclease [Spongiactinospora sp. TRM90649]|uniref:exonuclease n=1 Tax=Spongiactinospora sp. TRM90649 TaxID=3031114 RepID=UPI0023F85DD9|nr:exonuclease [Spongiactinospora sp. TRM90649]MDF5754816.1 exonuclease [Spongiactinospora sp. TRM90649]